MKIGFFDSGFGGLTILKEVRAALPEYSYVYLGDNARAPYGNRPPEIIREFTSQGIKFLVRQGCTLILLACNSASVSSLPDCAERYKDKAIILGVVDPLIDHLADSRFSTVGLIATRATIDSQGYEKALARAGSTLRILSRACPLLVPLIEEGMHTSIPGKMILKTYLRPFTREHIDAMILGCTHYPILYDRIRAILGKKVVVLHPGRIMTSFLVRFLAGNPILNEQLEKDGHLAVFTTDSTDKFLPLAQRFWKSPLSVTHTTLE